MKTILIFSLLSLCIICVHSGSRKKFGESKKKTEKTEESGMVKMLNEKAEKCRDEKCPVDDAEKKHMLNGGQPKTECGKCLVKCMVCGAGMCDDKEQLHCENMKKIVLPYAVGKEMLIDAFMMPKCAKIGNKCVGCEMGQKFMEEYGDYMGMIK